MQIEDTIDLTAAGIREVARRWRASETAERALIVVDYLQLVADDCRDAEVLRSLLGTAKQVKASLLFVTQHLADGYERASVESLATAVVYLRAELHRHEIVLVKHRHRSRPRITFALPHVGQAAG